MSVYRFEDGKVVEHWGMNDASPCSCSSGRSSAPGGHERAELTPADAHPFGTSLFGSQKAAGR